MAKANTVRKNKTTTLAPSEKSGKTPSIAMKLVDKLLLSAKTMLQSVTQFEVELQSAALKCLEHAETHGDVMPMDRLVKGLREMNHPVTTRFSDEIIAWVRGVSPIRWYAKGNPRQMKEGEDGYKPYAVQDGEETPFNETAMAKRARAAADAAHKRGLEPITGQDVLNRIQGVIKFVQSANQANRNGEVRGIKSGENAKIKRIVGNLQAFIVDNGGKIEDDKTEKAA